MTLACNWAGRSCSNHRLLRCKRIAAAAASGDEPSLRCKPLRISLLELLTHSPEGTPPDVFFQRWASMPAGEICILSAAYLLVALLARLLCQWWLGWAGLWSTGLECLSGYRRAMSNRAGKAGLSLATSACAAGVDFVGTAAVAGVSGGLSVLSALERGRLHRVSLTALPAQGGFTAAYQGVQFLLCSPCTWTCTLMCPSYCACTFFFWPWHTCSLCLPRVSAQDCYRLFASAAWCKACKGVGVHSTGCMFTGETWAGEQLALVLTGQLLPASPPATQVAYIGNDGPGRVVVRAALRSRSSEVLIGIESDLHTFVAELFQGAAGLNTIVLPFTCTCPVCSGSVTAYSAAVCDPSYASCARAGPAHAVFVQG